MRLDLRWRSHRRAPRPHVAEPGPFNFTTVYDLSKILLDVSDSPFMTMLAGEWVTLSTHVWQGQFFLHEGKWRKAYAVEQIDSDDWFAAPAWRVRISEPWLSTQHPTHHWLEDELMPRVTTPKYSWKLD